VHENELNLVKQLNSTVLEIVRR